MLIDTNYAAASICPECSRAVISQISLFGLSGETPIKGICLFAGCKTECFSLTQKKKKIKIKADCAFCGDTHYFTIDSDKLWSKGLITLPCPESGLDLFFFGSPENVKDAVSSHILGLEKLYEKLDEAMFELSMLDDKPDDGCDDDIVCDILEELYFLQHNGDLSCICGNDSLSINVPGDKISLSCPKCHRSKLFDINEQTLSMVLNATAIILGR